MYFLKLLLRIGGWSLVGTALIELLFAFSIYRHTRDFVQSASRADGIVTRFVYKPGQNSYALHHPVYAFWDAKGNEHEIFSSAGSYPFTYEIGDTITMLYRPDQPNEGIPDTFLEVWNWPILVGALGVLQFITGLGILLVDFIIQRRWGRRSVIQAPQTEAPAPALTVTEATYQIAFNGEDIGAFTVPEIRDMVGSGKLTLQDYYYDFEANDWTPLERLEEFGQSLIAVSPAGIEPTSKI